MPTYVHECDNGHTFDLILRFNQLDEMQHCECGRPAVRVICAPMMVSVQRDICYDSPIDGKPITSKQARIEDMARAGCIEYDPGMKQDYQRRIEHSERDLEARVEQSVERSIHEMPARKRELLESELRSGVEAETVRITPDQQSARP